MVDIAASPMSPPMSELTPVQRSSSLRLSRLRSPDSCGGSLRRRLERRRTCVPFIGPQLAADGDADLQQAGVTDDDDDNDDDDVANDAQLTDDDDDDDDLQSGVCVIRIGADDIEIEEGKVKRTMRGKELMPYGDSSAEANLSFVIDHVIGFFTFY